MLAVIFAVIAGAVMSVQGVVNTSLSARTGVLESSVIVQAVAFFASALVTLFFGKGNIGAFVSADRWSLTGGLLGVVITVTVMLAVRDLSATVAVSVILVSQLLTAAVIDWFGWFGAEKRPFVWNQAVALALFVAAILLFKADFAKK